MMGKLKMRADHKWEGPNADLFADAPVGTVIRFNSEHFFWVKDEADRWVVLRDGGSSSKRQVEAMQRCFLNSAWSITLIVVPEPEVLRIPEYHLRALENEVNERIENAYAKGYAEGYAKAYAGGYEEGHEEGHEVGYRIGYRVGREEG